MLNDMQRPFAVNFLLSQYPLTAMLFTTALQATTFLTPLARRRFARTATHATGSISIREQLPVTYFTAECADEVARDAAPLQTQQSW